MSRVKLHKILFQGSISKTPPLPTEQKLITCPHCPRACYFMLHQYQGLAIKAEPLNSRKPCGIGRFAHVWAANTAAEDIAQLCCEDKARILRAFTGDLRYYEGDKGEFGEDADEKIGEICIKFILCRKDRACYIQNAGLPSHPL